MAKGNTILVKMLSSAGTGFFYVWKKNPRNQTEKLKNEKVRSQSPQARGV